ncbi:hypothetical protein B0F87_10235 [Methylobacter tundripaludum]|uniref:Uncharacterized protein n=1 Tax=Methylobacter tundripaludum TaxID=173365 RepID=A0A2S6HHT0_9GAMM|nr:hypothetical protein B0F87_10235 [Methylobacter tundripaludum]
MGGSREVQRKLEVCGVYEPDESFDLGLDVSLESAILERS